MGAIIPRAPISRVLFRRIKTVALLNRFMTFTTVNFFCMVRAGAKTKQETCRE